MESKKDVGADLTKALQNWCKVRRQAFSKQLGTLADAPALRQSWNDLLKASGANPTLLVSLIMDEYRVAQGVKTLPPAKFKRHYEKLATTLDSLSKELNSDIEFENLWPELVRDCTDVTEARKMILLVLKLAASDVTGFQLPHGEKERHQISGMVAQQVLAEVHSLPRMLSKMARVARDLAARGPHSDRPSYATAPAAVFVRRVAHEIEAQFGKALPHSFGSIAASLFGLQDVDVKDILSKSKRKIKKVKGGTPP